MHDARRTNKKEARSSAVSGTCLISSSARRTRRMPTPANESAAAPSRDKYIRPTLFLSLLSSRQRPDGEETRGGEEALNPLGAMRWRSLLRAGGGKMRGRSSGPCAMFPSLPPREPAAPGSKPPEIASRAPLHSAPYQTSLKGHAPEVPRTDSTVEPEQYERFRLLSQPAFPFY